VSPSDLGVTHAIAKFDGAHIHGTWQKALERRNSDPEGAITSARTMLESVCKHILDASGGTYDDGDDMNKLYRQTAERLTPHRPSIQKRCSSKFLADVLQSSKGWQRCGIA
jgi:hypothetical protein